MEPDPIPTDNRPEWLRALTEKSWNLELVISGAAIFLANYLPAAVDNLLRYYLENLVMDEDLKKISLPLLVYSFMKVVAWLLILTFVVHFVMRAFWAGVVGLHTVYTEGILYEKLLWQTDFTKAQMRERFGLLSDYILRLDRLCNQVFSTAFLIALLSIGICMAYIMFFLIINVLPVFLGKSLGLKVSIVLLSFFMIMAFIPGLTQLAMRVPRLAALPWLKRLTAWSVRNSGHLLMPMVYRPMSYLNMTFTSQIPKKRLMGLLFFGTVVVVGGVLITFTSTLLHLTGRTDLNTRDFFAIQTDSALMVCMTSFFRLSLNDSLIAEPGWMFHEHPVVGSPGVVAYLPTTNFKNGKNVLTVQVPSSENPDSLRMYGQVPFWFAPKE